MPLPSPYSAARCRVVTLEGMTAIPPDVCLTLSDGWTALRIYLMVVRHQTT